MDVEARVREFLTTWKEKSETEKKTRKCLICDREFSSFQNRICPTCHKRHAKLFSTMPTGQYEDLIYNVDPPGENHSEAPQSVQEGLYTVQDGGDRKR